VYTAYNVAKNFAAPVARKVWPGRGSLGLDGDVGAALDALEAMAPLLSGMAPGAGAMIVELGPGRAPEVTGAFVLAGADEAIGLDVALQVPADATAAGRYRELADALARGEAPMFSRAVGLDGATMKARLAALTECWPARFEIYDGVHIPLPTSSVDLVLSNAVLEHVRQPRELVFEMHRVLKPGGVAVHVIDLRDHLHIRDANEVEGDWLEALRHSDRAFRAMFFNRSTYINRLRARDWRMVFEMAGFEIARWTARTLELPPGFDRTALNERWADLPEEELRIAGVQLAARAR
jgi:SAM-dependent methyltransferase